MLLRVIVNNIYSFGKQTELNMFTNKSQRHLHHKRTIGDISFLKMAALYGANGAGKSNLIKAMSVLVKSIKTGKIPQFADSILFKLNSQNTSTPVSVGVEFVLDDKPYFYTISFDNSGVLYEYLTQSGRDSEVKVFERYYEAGKERISFHEGFESDPKNRLFTEMLSGKFVGRFDLLLSILNEKYGSDFPLAVKTYKWFTETLVIIGANERVLPIAQILEGNKEMLGYANLIFSRLSTGVDKLSVNKYELRKTEENSVIYERLEKNPNTIYENRNSITGDVVNYVKEGDKIIAKKVNAFHKDNNGDVVQFGLGQESDGTQRLVDFMPMLYDVIYGNHVYVIDEIERSIHPVIIKELITLLSNNKDMKGQVLFTTHESCLLDQRILRTDEIWFAQKNPYGSTILYSLSDYNVHGTANIENGYLSGRYGGIPFMSNLNELHWDDEQK